MTIIVWDGSILATDRAATDGVAKWQTDKAWYYGEGEDRVILSGAGPLSSILEMREWVKGGAEHNKFPSGQTTNPCHFIVVSPYQGLYRFESTPYVIPHGDQQCAFGDGREFAYGALAMGATAKQAVEVANQYSLHCGLGVKEFSL